MLGLITGVPGAKKTVFIVSKLDKIESDNKVNLVKNISVYEHNKKIIDDNNLQNELTYFHDDVGSGHELKQILTILDDDHFDMLVQDYEDLRPDNYYKIASIYNIIIDRISETNHIKGLKFMQPVRTIYANINALKIDYCRSLADLLDDRGYVDWRLAPDGSIIVIDEVQLVEPYKQTKNKDEPIIQDLTIHRHRGFDIYYITQSANLLHVQIKDLIGIHWHITVPWGWVSKVYQYGSYRQNPNAVSIKMSAERKFSFSPDARLFKLYKSTTINTHEKRIPYKPLLGFTAVIVLAISFFTFAISSAKDSSLVKNMTGAEVASVASPALSPASVKAPDAPVPPKPPIAPVVPTSQPYVQSVRPDAQVTNLYNPVTGDYYASVDVAVAGAVMVRGKCQAFNKKAQNVPMPDSECSKYLDTFGNMAKS